MKRALVVAVVGGGALAAVAPLVAVTASLAVVAGQLLSPALSAAPAPSPPPAGGSPLGGIPPSMLPRYVEAAATCPGLSWTVLAAIGTVESDNGQSTLPGVHSGHNFAGAEGPMQFEPATFARYDRPVPPGGADPPSPYDPTDATFAAARMLCANGAGGAAGPGRGDGQRGTGRPAGPRLGCAGPSWPTTTRPPTSTRSSHWPRPWRPKVVRRQGRQRQERLSGQVALAFALAQIGTPYRWGAEAAGAGFDCSGLTQAAWAAAGIEIPRVAAQQFQAGSVLPPSEPLAPGDLVFFAAPAGVVSHVGLYVGRWRGQAIMVDAPHPGADVRLEPFPPTPGATWGGEVFVGATDPSR